MYHTIISLDDYQDDKAAELLEQRDYDALARYLSGWDYGEYHDEPHELSRDPFADRVKVSVPFSGDYILEVNHACGWMALLTEAE